MGRTIFWLLLSCNVACATLPTTGTFVEHPAPGAMQQLAIDAARQLALLYPPKGTHVSFAQATNDAFALPLLSEVRGLGFAVTEGRTRGSQISLSYVIDEVDPFYRVVLHVASARRRVSLARAYTHRATTVRAASAWAQQVTP